MALTDAILEIAQQMEEDAPELEKEFGGGICRIIMGYVRQIRSVVKAAENENPPQQHNPMLSLLTPTNVPQGILSPHVQQLLQQDLQKVRSKQHEETAGTIAYVEGGPANPDDQPTIVTIEPGMPDGAYMSIAGGVYQKQGNKLIHQPDYGK